MILTTRLQLRLLSADDAVLLSEVAIRAYSDHYLHLWHDAGAWYINRSFTPDVLRQQLNDLNASFYLIYTDEKPVGFLKMNLNQPSPCTPALDALELERIYLQQDATGQGIGKTIIRFVLDQARQRKKQVVWLKSMDSSHDALAFYQKMGFHVCGTDRLTFETMRSEVRGMVTLQQLL